MKQERLTAGHSRITLQEFRALAERQKAGPGKHKSKYHARKCNGYDSHREYDRAQQLKLMLRAGLISDLREQVSFELIPAHRFEDGALERSCRYIADFVYTDNATGLTVVEDTKGVRTKEYIIKRKLMLYRHGIRIKEV